MHGFRRKNESYCGVEWKFIREVEETKSDESGALESPNYGYTPSAPDIIDKLISMPQRARPVVPNQATTNVKKFVMIESMMQEVHASSNNYYRSKLLKQEPNPQNQSVAERLDLHPTLPSLQTEPNDLETSAAIKVSEPPTIFWRPSERVYKAENVPNGLYKESNMRKASVVAYGTHRRFKPSIRGRKASTGRSGSIIKVPNAPGTTVSGRKDEVADLFIAREFKKYVEAKGHRCPTYLCDVPDPKVG